jgi:L-alanine-DL-glutamate epimerase-like enolase superfamily enzyme
MNMSVLDFYGTKIKALPTSVTIGIKETKEMLIDAEEYFKLGFKILKIKTGLDVDADIERVRSITEKFASKMLVRVDANQGYSLEDLKKFINKTEASTLELIEQPIKTGQESVLQSMGIEDRKKLVADESLIDAKTAWKFSLPPQSFGVYNIKLMKSGGIKGAREIATIAKNADIDLFWGCNDESIVSITAALHAAYSCSNTKYLDIDGSFDLAKDLVEGGFELKDGYMYPSSLPGLGIKKLD